MAAVAYLFPSQHLKSSDHIHIHASKNYKNKKCEIIVHMQVVMAIHVKIPIYCWTPLFMGDTFLKNAMNVGVHASRGKFFLNMVSACGSDYTQQIRIQHNKEMKVMMRGKGERKGWTIWINKKKCVSSEPD